MEISNDLLCLFSGDVKQEDGRYLIEVPAQEIETGNVDVDTVYRVALIERSEETTSSNESVQQPPARSTPETTVEAQPDQPQPPVEPGEVRYVEIEDIGKQGDGIARVERGYVIIVPGAEMGERVKVEVSEVKSNFAVGEIIEEEF